MDDHHFDEFIKKKAEGYQESGVDPAALTDFRRRLEHLPWTPWYVRYRNALGWGAAMVLFTLVNVGLVWYLMQSKNAMVQTQLAELQLGRTQLQELQNEIQYLKSVKLDTVYVYRSNDTSFGFADSQFPQRNSGSQGLAQYLGQPVASTKGTQETFVIAQDEEGRSFLKLGSYQDLPKEVQQFISQNASFMRDDQGNLYLPLDQKYSRELRQLQTISPIGVDGNVDPLAFTELGKSVKEEKEKPRLSGKIARALEKQNYSGWGFQTGLELHQFNSVPDIGSNHSNSSIGLLGEFILSPHWRIETGALHSNLRYEIDGFNNNSSLLEQVSSYPGYDESLGELNEAAISSTIIRLPANLKYYYPLASRSRLYASFGLSPYLFLSQRFSYKYTESEDSGIETFVASKTTLEENKLYLGTLNTGLGGEVDINGRWKWQMGIYYEKGLSDFGAEANGINNYGIKTSLWFRLK